MRHAAAAQAVRDRPAAACAGGSQARDRRDVRPRARSLAPPLQLAVGETADEDVEPDLSPKTTRERLGPQAEDAEPEAIRLDAETPAKQSPPSTGVTQPGPVKRRPADAARGVPLDRAVERRAGKAERAAHLERRAKLTPEAVRVARVEIGRVGDALQVGRRRCPTCRAPMRCARRCSRRRRSVRPSLRGERPRAAVAATAAFVLGVSALDAAVDLVARVRDRRDRRRNDRRSPARTSARRRPGPGAPARPGAGDSRATTPRT